MVYGIGRHRDGGSVGGRPLTRYHSYSQKHSIIYTCPHLAYSYITAGSTAQLSVGAGEVYGRFTHCSCALYYPLARGGSRPLRLDSIAIAQIGRCGGLFAR
jgi:hypothetical protein